jgi:uncharacterized protein (UPF0332 family)
MPTLNPDHLFEQAQRLIIPPPHGPPRQVDVRRAISAAYYGMFHFVSTCLADEFVGSSLRQTGRYALVYRSIDHRALRDVCGKVANRVPPETYVTCIPKSGLEPGVRQFARVAVDLQKKRHQADYDPLGQYRTSDAAAAIDAARVAVQRFQVVSADQRKAFLTLLLCPPR